MLKRVLYGVGAGLAGICLAAAAHADVVTFEDLPIPSGSYVHMANNLVDGGLHFMDQDFSLIPTGLVGLPLNNTSQFVEVGSGSDASDPNLMIALAGGGPFNLNSLNMGLGDWNYQTADGFDTVTVVGQKAANCQFDCTNPTVTLQVGDAWGLYSFAGFTGLSSVTVFQQIITADGQSMVDPGWLAIDNVDYSVDPTGGVGAPEPAAWALMILGFGAVGAALRRRRPAACAA